MNAAFVSHDWHGGANSFQVEPSFGCDAERKLAMAVGVARTAGHRDLGSKQSLK